MPSNKPGLTADDGAPNRAAGLFDLFTAGHFEQVVGQGRRLLERHPLDASTHYYLVLALVALKRPREAKRHLDFLLDHAPDDAISHHAACRYFMHVKRWRDARKHIRSAIALEPDEALYHREAAVVALQKTKAKEAKASLETALRLDPQDPDTLHLYLVVRGLNETTAREAWQRIRHFKEALALDPGNAELHASIGEVYFEELDQPREAEENLREALRLDPSCRNHQKLLFRAVGQQRLLYRMLSIPSRTWAYVGNLLRGLAVKPWLIIFWLVAFKFALGFLLWLLLATIIFLPPAKIYEWLLIAEIRCAADVSNQGLRLKRRLNRWPFWVRFSSFLVLVLGLWAGFFSALGISLASGFLVLGIVVGIHFALTLIVFLCRKARAAFGRRQADKRPQPLTIPPPPLPS